jgi:hypothetical protein
MSRCSSFSSGYDMVSLSKEPWVEIHQHKTLLSLALLEIKTLLEEKTVIVKLGESKPRFDFHPANICILHFVYSKLNRYGRVN